MKSGIKEIYFFIHQPDNTLAPDLGYDFIKKWNQGQLIPIPEPHKIRQEIQMSLF